MESLIKSVERHPAIWKTDSNEFKQSEMKCVAWEDVFRECKMINVREAKRCWKNLRDNFRQVLYRKQTGASNKVWKYEEALEFLIPYINSKCAQGAQFEAEIDNEQKRSIVSHDPLGRFDNVLVEIDNESEVTDKKQDEIVLPSRKRPKQEYNIQILSESDLINSNDEDSNNSGMNIADDSNNAALDSFFTSMCQSTLTLPAYLQLKVQRSIFDIVMDAKAEYLRDKEKHKLKRKSYNS